jgi:O-antigen/teichoic acid export membrane protein
MTSSTEAAASRLLSYAPGFVRGRIGRAVSYTVVGFIVSRLIQLVSSLTLTRLLAPEIFGVLALANVVLVGLRLFSDLGLGPSIIRSARGDDTVFLNTVWTLGVVRGFAIWALACLLAQPMPAIYGEPVLYPLVCVLGASVAIRSLSSVATSRLERKIQIGKIVRLELTAQFVNFVATAIAAWLLGSVWALAIGSLVGSTVYATLSHISLPPFRHRLVFERAAFREILSFGGWIFFATLLQFFAAKGRILINGLLVEPEFLAMIALATTFSWALGDLMKQLLKRVGFPAMAQIVRDSPERVRGAVARTRLALNLPSLPAFFALSLFAQPLIDFLYDPCYALAGSVLAIAAINASLNALPMAYQTALLAGGDSRAHFNVMAVTAGLRVAFSVGGFLLFGPLGMIGAVGFANVGIFAVSFVQARKRGFAAPAMDALALGLIAVFALYRFTIFEGW